MMNKRKLKIKPKKKSSPSLSQDLSSNQDKGSHSSSTIKTADQHIFRRRKKSNKLRIANVAKASDNPVFNIERKQAQDSKSLKKKAPKLKIKKSSRNDGNAGYGEVSSVESFTSSNAPTEWRGKFGYYFRKYPQELQQVLQMDEVASFSVTEATFADKISRILVVLPNLSSKTTIVDATAGVGGNSMSFLCYFSNVISVEIDQNTSRMLQNNLTHAKNLLNCRNKGNFSVFNGDFMILKNTTDIFRNKVDIIFFDPPWGGRDYLEKSKLRLTLGHRFLSDICNEISAFTKYIALKLPKNYDIEEFTRQINPFGGNILIIESLSNRRGIEKMKIVVIEYNIPVEREVQAAKKSSDEESVVNEIRDFSLSSYPFSYNTERQCNQNKQKFPVITDPEEFYNLIPENLSLNKPITKENLRESRDSNEDRITHSELSLEIYKNLDRNSIINTFNYLFYKIRIGIFVLIKDNKLKYFIPFQNMDFRNNWADKIRYREGINNLDEYINNKFRNTGSRESSLENDLNKWSANNCLIGNWTGNEIGDMGWYELREILHLTCENKTINDCAFFFNRRDHPVITPNKTEPYFHIFNNLTTPLTTHNYPNYVPILSYSKNDNFADILFPNYADWRNITGKIYPSSCTNMNMGAINLDWNSKRPQAVFRGSATGCGTTIEDNQRIRLSWLSNTWTNAGRNDLLDAGLVGKNLRDKKFTGKPMDFFRYRDYGLQFAKRLPMNEQSNFKYIVHVDGHVSAYRLGKELSLGSCILKVDSLYNYKLWFSHLMQPRKHYLPVQKDLSDLGSAIIWARSNDIHCKKIAENAGKLYIKIMTRDFILSYTENLINSISHNFSI